MSLGKQFIDVAGSVGVAPGVSMCFCFGGVGSRGKLLTAGNTSSGGGCWLRLLNLTLLFCVCFLLMLTELAGVLNNSYVILA